MAIKFSPGPCGCCNTCGCDGELPTVINAVVAGFKNDPTSGFDNLSNLNRTYLSLKSTSQQPCIYVLNLAPPILIGSVANGIVAITISVTLTNNGPVGSILVVVPSPIFFSYIFEPAGLGFPPYPCKFSNIQLTFAGVRPGPGGQLDPTITMTISAN